MAYINYFYVSEFLSTEKNHGFIKQNNAFKSVVFEISLHYIVHTEAELCAIEGGIV